MEARKVEVSIRYHPRSYEAMYQQHLNVSDQDLLAWLAQHCPEQYRRATEFSDQIFTGLEKDVAAQQGYPKGYNWAEDFIQWLETRTQQLESEGR